MFSIPTLVSLFLLAAPKLAFADPCVTFDADFNLLAFGLNGKDWNAGPQDSWGSGSATDITASGRPPFDGTGTTCYMAQFFNAIYVLNGDKSKPSDVHIYDATAKSWTTQAVDAGQFDLSDFTAILDHDTNVFYAISKGEVWFLDMGSLKSANATALQWGDAQEAPFGADYKPTMGLAQNHVHFIGVPGLPDGSADIFVIHFSFFQPQPQAYPGANGGPTFPSTHGQIASFFQESGVQQEFAFIPDDGSMTYVINVENNSTTTLAAPPAKDANARYAASISALVQLDSTGALSYVPYTQGDDAANKQAGWASVAKIAAVAPPSASSAGASASGTGKGASATGGTAIGPAPTGTGTGANSAAPSDGSNGALANAVGWSAMAGALLAAFAALQ